MSLPERQDDPPPPLGDPSWFRAPNRREHAVGAAVFLGFGLFFGVFFLLEAGTRFRWVILVLLAISMVRGLRHGWIALMARKHE